MKTTKNSVGAALLVALSVLGATGVATAQDLSPKAKKAKRAEALNVEGKKLVGRLDLEGAAERFRDAWQLMRDPRFAFNLCYTLEKSGKLYEARVACQQVVNTKDKRLASKAKQLLKAIEKKMPAEPAAPVVPVTGQPATGQPTTGQPMTGTAPPVYPQPVNPVYPGGAYPQTNYIVAPQRTTDKYFTHVLLADAASWSVIALSAGAESDGLIGLGVAGLLIGGPIVHLMHNNTRGAWLSTGARIGMPLAGMLVGSGSCDLDNDCLGSVIGGAVVGYAGALVLDWFVFAKHEKVTYSTQGMAMPTLEIKRGGAVAGLAFQL